MAAEFERVQNDIRQLSNDEETFEPEIDLSETDRIVFFLSDQDLSKREEILNTDRTAAMEFYYLKAVSKLNELKSYLSTLQKAEATP